MDFYPPGIVIIPCSDQGRYTAFAESMVQLRPPLGTKATWAKSSTIVGNLNLAIYAKRDDPDWEWAWIIGDDHTFPPNIIHRLIESDVDIVVPLCSRRGPFHPVIYQHIGEGADTAHGGEVYPRFRAHTLDEISSWGPGVHPVDAAGSAGMLIRRQVFDTLGFPYFTSSSPHYLNEDVLFCLRAKDAGFRTHVDTRLTIGHVGSFTITPRWLDGQLRQTINFSGGTQLVLEEGRAFDVVEDEAAVV